MTTPLSPDQSRRVEQFAPRVPNMARRVAASASHASVDELASAGYEGLVRAAQRYDPGTGVPFAAFAFHRVRGAMLDAARAAAPAARRRSRAMKALQATQALLEEAESRQPSPNAGDPRTLRERVEAASALVAQATTAVLMSRLPPVDPEMVGDGAEAVDAAVDRQLRFERLRRVVAGRNDADRALIEALYDRGLTMQEYAAELGTSTSTVSRHHTRLVAQLFESLRDDPLLAPEIVPATAAAQRAPLQAEATVPRGRGPPGNRSDT